MIILASLNNAAFANGYVIEKDELAIPDAGWKEVFNSDAAIYGGENVGNFGATIPRPRPAECCDPRQCFCGACEAMSTAFDARNAPDGQELP